MDRYTPERVHRRVDYIQYIYWNCPDNFESFTYPLAVYNRDGTVTDANKLFRELVSAEPSEVASGTISLFDRLNERNAGLAETARNTFDGNERAYEGADRLLCAAPETAAYHLLNRFPNAIFFPVARDKNGIRLAGILLDENKPDDTK